MKTQQPSDQNLVLIRLFLDVKYTHDIVAESLPLYWPFPILPQADDVFTLCPAWMEDTDWAITSKQLKLDNRELKFDGDEGPFESLLQDVFQVKCFFRGISFEIYDDGQKVMVLEFKSK